MITRTEFRFTVRVVEDLKIPLPDGTILAAKAWLPEAAGPVTAGPVTAGPEYLPHRKRDGTRARDQGSLRVSSGMGRRSVNQEGRWYQT